LRDRKELVAIRDRNKGQGKGSESCGIVKVMKAARRDVMALMECGRTGVWVGFLVGDKEFVKKEDVIKCNTEVDFDWVDVGEARSPHLSSPIHK